MLDALSLAGGLVLMTFAADRFVLGAARLSLALRISPVIIGAIIIGFGTSAPELIVTVLATLRGSQDLAFGNVVGSNTANILLVLGAAGLIRPLAIGIGTLRRELPLSLTSLLLLAIATYNLRVALLDALALLVAGVLAVVFIVWTGLRDREAADVLAAEVREYEGQEAPAVVPAVVLAVAGLIGTLIGAQLLVNGAVGIARTFGLSEAVIGLTVVAVGTSLPELVTAVMAARRGETDLVVGNILGSNLFNSLVVAGVAGALDTVRLDDAFHVGVLFMMGAGVLGALFLRTGHRLGRREGALLLAGFVIFNVVTF